jgi:phosphoglycerol transferase MdoB-like AlkP superfamily enzyme
MNGQKYDREGWASRILTAGATLSIFLMLVRAQVEGFYSWSLSSVLKLFPRTVLAAYYDLLYVASISLFFLLCIVCVRSNPRLQRLMGHTYSVVAVFSLVVALANVKLVKVLGGPLTYQWLYYSDFMGSVDLRNDLWSTDSQGLLAVAIVMTLVLLIVPRLAARAVENAPLWRVRSISFAGIGCLAVYFSVATPWVAMRDHDRLKLVNPVVSFFRSIISSRQAPALFTMNTSLVFDDLPDQTDAPEPLPIRNTALPGKEVRNVVIFVLESVPAEYIDAYGEAFSATPELNRYRRHSALFRNIYAHAPTSNESLVSMLLSIYPWISYKTLTREYPAIDFPSLSSELKKYGYRNAFFSSGDTRFQRADTFLSHREIDKIEDFRSLRCHGRIWIGSTRQWPFMDSTDDECLVKPFMDWAVQSPKAPFFAILWTTNTHYPYYVAGEERDFGAKEPLLNRYLNALHNSDRVLGTLLRRLEDRQLLDSTLVIVVSDHGEAFGRHQQFIHATKIYEENVHIPLILIQPTFFNG